MKNQEIINDIENYYPIDCVYPDTATIGKHLIIKAMEQVNFDWRTLPDNVLLKLRELCFEEEESGELTHFLREKELLNF